MVMARYGYKMKRPLSGATPRQPLRAVHLRAIALIIVSDIRWGSSSNFLDKLDKRTVTTCNTKRYGYGCGQIKIKIQKVKLRNPPPFDSAQDKWADGCFISSGTLPPLVGTGELR